MVKDKTGVITPIVERGTRVKQRGTTSEGAIVDDTTLSKLVVKGSRGGEGHKIRKRLRAKSGGKKNIPNRRSGSSDAGKMKCKRSCSRKTNKKNAGEVRQTAYRASLNGIRLLIDDLNLNEDHIDIMKKTPFWQLFKAILDKKLTAELCRKQDRLIIDIINAYEPETDSFKLGTESTRINRADIAKIFGIVDGSERVILKQGSRDAVNMVKSGLLTDERLTSTSIKLAAKNNASKTDMRFKKDVVRLICAYLLHSLFFPVGTTVRWVFLERVEDLDRLGRFDWCGAILDELMTSVRQHHREPRKVSGCVVALLYWVCERTNLVKPIDPEEHLGVIRWRTRDLSKELRKTLLSDLKTDQVVRSIHYDIDDAIPRTPNDGPNVETDPTCKDGSGCEQGHGSFGTGGQTWMIHCDMMDYNVGTSSNKDGSKRDIPEYDTNARVIDLLRGQIANMTEQLKQNNERHSDEIARKNEEIERKDAEIERKNSEIAGLNEMVFVLLGEKSRLCDELTESIVHGVTQRARPMIEMDQERSMVRRLRSRSRRDTKKKEYLYENKRKRSTDLGDPDQVVDVENFTAEQEKVVKKPLPIRNINAKPVYRNLSKDCKEEIKRMWSEAHTSTVIWKGKDVGCALFVEDFRHLILDSALPGNVIDAYAEVLLTEQEKRTKEVEGGCTQSEFGTTYVFTCSFLTMLSSKRDEDRKRVLDNMMPRASMYRYLIFPIHLDFHWTLLVLDNEEGCWWFYNSLKDRRGVDPHYKAAEQMKNQVEAYWKSTQDGLLSTQDCRPIESVENSPQQADSSLDCGVVLCYIIRQYFRNEPVAAKFPRTECQRMRAEMVEAFLCGEDKSRRSY